MRVTKFEHAALLLEKGRERLFVDPGNYTTAITDAAGTVAVVITHEHPDHWTPEQLERIAELNPELQIFGPPGVEAAVAASGFPIAVTVVRAGDSVTAGSFGLRFFGGSHAVIHRSIPVIDNVGVLVDDELFYGGDSLLVPDGVVIPVLAVPAGAPWLKIGEVMDYVDAIKPRISFPTHEMLLSRAGKDLSNQRIQHVTELGGGEFHALEPGDTLDI